MFFDAMRSYELGLMISPDTQGGVAGMQYQTVADILEPVKIEPVKIPFDGTTPPILDTTQIIPVPVVTAAPEVLPTVYTAEQLNISKPAPLPQIGTNPPFSNQPIAYGEPNPNIPKEEEETKYFGFTVGQLALGGGAVAALLFALSQQKGK